jgi:hypothetical protein
MIDGVSPISPAAERMRRNRERQRGPSCHFGRRRVSTISGARPHDSEGSCKWDCHGMSFRMNQLLTLRTTRPKGRVP